MKISALFLVAVFALFTTTAPLLHAQDSGQPAVSSQEGDGSVQLSPLDTQGIKKYLLGPGDTIQVRVWGQPDLSGDVDVDSDGNVSELHFIDKPIPARCRTEKEVAKDIAAAYGRILKNPQVSVRVTGRNSRPPAIVFGAVRAPARVQMQRRVRLQELLTVSGGITDQANGDIQILHTEAPMCPEPGDEVDDVVAKDGSETAPMKIYKIEDLVAGKVASNPLIRPGDIVIVSEAKPVYITGMVNHPTGLYLQNGMSLSRAIAMVGGIRKEGKAEDVRIFRQRPGSAEQELIRVDFTAIKKKQKEDIMLQPYDIIDVPEANIFAGRRLIPTLARTLLGVGTSMITSGGSSLAYRVLY
ncbi:MAG TPA: polysaccharide biosynthesis/export family protein [Pyrinomonadaceae bacterium]|jgi:polysaccharide export outer membrane protein|nr:polysaccharide biosynthesis/export family protein [Pyrinomonadaceae bacterium]